MLSLWSVLSCCMFSWDMCCFPLLWPSLLSSHLPSHHRDGSVKMYACCLTFHTSGSLPQLLLIYCESTHLGISVIFEHTRNFSFQVSNALLGTAHVICLRQETLYPWTFLTKRFSEEHNIKQLQESDVLPSGNKHPHSYFYLCSWQWSKWMRLKTHRFYLNKKNVLTS